MFKFQILPEECREHRSGWARNCREKQEHESLTWNKTRNYDIWTYNRIKNIWETFVLNNKINKEWLKLLYIHTFIYSCFHFILVSQKFWTITALWMIHSFISEDNVGSLTDDVILPAPGVLSVTGEWAELIIGESVVQVTVVGVVKHVFDAPSETFHTE